MRKPSAALVLAVLLALSWIGFLASSPFAQQVGGPAPAQKWEYHLADIDYKEGVSSEAFQKQLNALGKDGWELCDVEGLYFILKRPKQ